MAQEIQQIGYACSFDLVEAGGENLVSEAGFDLRPHSGADKIVVYDVKNLQSDALDTSFYNGVTVVLDDIGTKQPCADILLNPNIYGESLIYPKDRYRKVLAGPKFSLVSKEFNQIRSLKSLNVFPDNIVISFGGSDIGQFSLELTKHLSVNQQVEVVLSPFCKDSDLAKCPNHVMAHRGANIKSLFKRANLFVGGAGTMAAEACAAGLPMILTRVAADQKLNADAWRKLGVEVYSDFDAKALAAAITRRCQTQEFSSSRSFTEIIDGFGPQRVAHEIDLLAQSV
ncbi:hypothetical protein [Thalassospira lucentensis]|uniref:hypothetical protein n=1 Tax=Thalassospira lucentensis TaxID=168935 RepID=UPI003D293C01